MVSVKSCRLLLLTGEPGIGKTSILLDTAKDLKKEGFKVGGMISREERSGNARLGFEVRSLNSNVKGWLARTSQRTGPRIGKYRVNLNDLESIGVAAIEDALRDSDIIVIDEVGPMELSSRRFSEAVIKAAQSEKLVIAIVHQRSSNQLKSYLIERKDARLYSITADNRDRLAESIVKEALKYLTPKDKDVTNEPGE